MNFFFGFLTGVGISSIVFGYLVYHIYKVFKYH